MDDKFWTEFEALVGMETPSPKEGWFTVQDYMAKYETSRSASHERLQTLKDKGLLEHKKASTGRNYYRIIKGK